jgi:hypothetical protein
MVKAILAGFKTQTRRVIKDEDYYSCITGDCDHWERSLCDEEMRKLCPYGIPGDRLWVRETFLPVVDGDPPGWYEYEGSGPDKMGYDGPDTILYRATDDHHPKRWRPGIHMPRWASRITLEITKVWFERVQDISEQEATQEGIPIDEALKCRGRYREAFSKVWDSINAKRGFGWRKNPYVWVIEFKRLEVRA